MLYHFCLVMSTKGFLEKVDVGVFFWGAFFLASFLKARPWLSKEDHI